MTDLVHLDVADQIATITLDSQHNRNALSAQLVTELTARLEDAAADPDVLAVVLAAAGPVFCSGADLSEAAGGGMVEGARGLVALQRLIATLPKPVVVRLHGPVRAGGLGLVGAADVVVAADTVTFAFTEVRLALAPAVISLTTVPRMNARAASRTFLTGETFDADAAVAYGLVTEAVAPDALDGAVETVLTGLRQAYPQGLRETKALLNADLVDRIDRLGETVAEQSAVLFSSDEARAAMLAFLERKKRG
ncbi:enoyl-CoA hydratase/methylglutaconyl-CoA hydratase [Mumia flava]|uniref:Enoyl-CoA hydratase/methylglutaconyl-CoA hydratase n=1 Tax=Mumia flava TaxID=1348852 RepID=A0A0B2B357_9ACTN|nr:enoyl-CoA hydratase family protein [Mumia flava]PJJ57913.1 enoyl-CoA hydratase/methylglutaconyl-CoA hydratase [Mumia flava]